MKTTVITRSRIKVNQSIEGETLERQIERILENGEGIGSEKEIIHTERKDGVQPAYDIRTDRFELAIDALEKVEKSRNARREGVMKIVEKEEDNGVESADSQVNENQ